jgi:NADH dehydrogenase FAD-containing subunit
VTVLEPGAVLAPELGLPGRFRWVADAETEGVDLRLATAVESIDPGGVVARRGEDAVRIAADSVVVTSERQAGSPLADALRAEGVAVTEVGDCRTVAGIEGANLDAALLAVALR